MDDDDSKKRKNRFHLDSPSNTRPTTKRKKPLQPDHDESEVIFTVDGIPSIISTSPSSTLIGTNSESNVSDVVVDDDLLSLLPFELSHKIFSYVGDFKNAILVCRRWRSLVDDGIASGVLLSREEMALVELNLVGVDSLDMTRLCYCVGVLQSIPHSIGALSNLEWLDLSGNALGCIPNSIGALSCLTELWLYDNRLQSIPETIGSLTNLSILDLHENQIATIPETIGALSKLRELHLDVNELTPESIPESISALRNLEILNLNDQRNGVQLSRPRLPYTCEVEL